MTQLSRTILISFAAGIPAALAVAEGGCSSGGPGNGDTGHDAATESSTPTPSENDGSIPEDSGQHEAAAQPTVTLTWSFTELAVQVGAGFGDAGAADAGDAGDAGSGAPVAGVRVCVEGMPSIPCATSDTTGTFVLPGLPLNSQLKITATKDGYRSVLMPIATGQFNVDVAGRGVAMIPTGFGDPSVGATIDWASHGAIMFFLLGPQAGVVGTKEYGDPGSSLSNSPDGGTGWKYLNADNTFSSGGVFTDILALDFNLAPGTVVTTIDSKDICEGIPSPEVWGYLGTTRGTVILPVLAGYITYGGGVCVSGPDAGAPDAASDASLDGGSEN